MLSHNQSHPTSLMEQPNNKSKKCKAVADFKIYAIVLIVVSMMVVSPKKMAAQSTCNDYYDRLDHRLTRLFTEPRHQDYRETEFPSSLHSVMGSEIRRLDLPQEQGVCDSILNAIYKNDPVKGPPTHHALYIVKDHYFMVIYKYYTSSDGRQLIEDPTAGGVYDSQFNLVSLVMM